MLGCVVMAAGEGRRFSVSGGADGPGGKLLADLSGAPLVARAVASVPRDLFQVVVVTRWEGVAMAVRALDGSVSVVRPAGGSRSETVRAGLAARADDWDACLFLPGDQPLVLAGSFHALAGAFAADPTRAYRLAWRGGAASPVLFPAPCFPALGALTGRDGGSSILRSGEVPVGLVPARDPRELWDVDTTADLERVRTAWSALARD